MVPEQDESPLLGSPPEGAAAVFRRDWDAVVRKNAIALSAARENLVRARKALWEAEKAVAEAAALRAALQTVVPKVWDRTSANDE